MSDRYFIDSRRTYYYWYFVNTGGYLSSSLAIATDASHLLTDFASFMISLCAIWVASRPATQSMPFGWYRAEVLGALTSVLLIWVVTGVLLYLAVERLTDMTYTIDADIMLITSAVGLCVNLVWVYIIILNIVICATRGMRDVRDVNYYRHHDHNVLSNLSSILSRDVLHLYVDRWNMTDRSCGGHVDLEKSLFNRIRTFKRNTREGIKTIWLHIAVDRSGSVVTLHASRATNNNEISYAKKRVI